ncbi:hypothetical protein [Hydrogenophaga palleronii]|uniref:hypothetical protein n=1 Tax=Hydrogenophaga palleronii TaxID=65655 RepID=UPI000825136B|nr:hypothetical protein [Hydrogenophaga palleronii]
MRLSLWHLMGASLLTGCVGYAPPADLTGLTGEQIVARMGPPETRRQVDGGTRLEFPRGPYGTQTWFVYLDGAGRAVRAEQVLDEANFVQILPGMDEGEVRARLGRPGEVQGLARERGSVWSYRYDNPFCRWFQVEITQDHKVRSAGYGEPPECQRRDRIPFLF